MSIHDIIKRTIGSRGAIADLRKKVAEIGWSHAQHMEAAQEFMKAADYIAAAIHWRQAAHTFPPGQLSRRMPDMIMASECEELFLIFNDLCQLIDRDLGFGKRMGTAVYIHGMYRLALPRAIFQPAYERFLKETEETGMFNVIKWDRANNCITFLWYKDLIFANEPQLRDCYVVPYNHQQKVRYITYKDGPILHHKWMVVKEGFDGFDLVESVKRSLAWKRMTLPAGASRRIGQRAYWESEVVPYIKTLP